MNAVKRSPAGAWMVALVAALSLTGGPTPRRAQGQPRGPGAGEPPIPILWLQPADERQAGGELPVFRPIPPDDARVKDAERLVGNEAAVFTRSLVAWAWHTFPPPPDWTPPRLPVVLTARGNNAEKGFRLDVEGRLEEHPEVPYLLLDLDAQSLSNTLIHEGGHLLHSIATGGRRPSPWWTATPHSTFAVTDPLTALAEGYAIHFETLWAHYGRQAEMRAFYHRLAPAFDLKNSRRAEFYAPIADLMTFSQTWARYQAVRDTWPSFCGHVYPGDYLRSQYDPARDRAVLKSANAMVASEGVAASTIFWTVAGVAEQGGAKPGEGLQQPSILAAEQTVLRGFAALPAPAAFRPDIVDLVSAVGAAGSPARTLAVSRFVSVTRGVTARADVRASWSALYHDALGLDFEATKPLFTSLDTAREEILQAAWKDPATLRKQLGPVLPVRSPKVRLELKMIGEAFELDFDLNAAGEAEWLAAGADRAAADALPRERDRAPFASIRDFEKRTGRSLTSLGLVLVEQ
jgi:hypothetical protein